MAQPNLREAVESILNQTFTDFELILIDDGSNDATAEILDEYASRDARIILRRNQKNMGLARSLNQAISMSAGEYIARMDADDISLPDRLSQQRRFLETRPQVGVLGGAYQIIDSVGSISSPILNFPTEHNTLKWRLCFENPIVHPAVMMRPEVVRRANGYNPEMANWGEDYDLWQRLSGITQLSNVSFLVLSLRKHEDNVSSRKRQLQFERNLQISQRMMSETLGQEVPIQQVRHVWRKEYDSFGDFYRVARLIYRLCRASTADSGLSRIEKQTIRQDAVRRLLRLFRPRTYGLQAWIMLGWACRLAPLLSSKYVVGMVQQRLNCRVRGSGWSKADACPKNSPPPSNPL